MFGSIKNFKKITINKKFQSISFQTIQNSVNNRSINHWKRIFRVTHSENKTHHILRILGVIKIC